MDALRFKGIELGEIQTGNDCAVKPCFELLKVLVCINRTLESDSGAVAGCIFNKSFSKCHVSPFGLVRFVPVFRMRVYASLKFVIKSSGSVSVDRPNTDRKSLCRGCGEAVCPLLETKAAMRLISVVILDDGSLSTNGRPRLMESITFR